MDNRKSMYVIFFKISYSQKLAGYSKLSKCIDQLLFKIVLLLYLIGISVSKHQTCADMAMSVPQLQFILILISFL